MSYLDDPFSSISNHLSKIEKDALWANELFNYSGLDINDTTSAIGEAFVLHERLLSQYTSLLEPDTLGELIQNILPPISNSGELGAIASALEDSYSDTVQQFSQLFASSELFTVIRNLSNHHNPEDEADYITIDESVIKEYEIPDSIAIPIGHNKVRIKTEFFVTLLVTIILGVASIAIGLYQSAKDSQAQLAAEEKQTQLKLMEIDILNKILQSVDSSTSTQNEAIQGLKEYLQVRDSTIAELQESDQAQNKRIEVLESSAHTSQCSCNTESELENTETKK